MKNTTENGNVLDNVSGILCDIDGVIWDSQDNKDPLPGIPETIRYVKEDLRLPIRFVTNTTTRSLDTLYNDISQRGFPIERFEIVTPPLLAAEYLRAQGNPSVHLIMRSDTKGEFDEFRKDDRSPDYIVIGNNRDRWDYRLLNGLFEMMMHGSKLLALHKQKYWHEGGEIKVDIGCFVTGLEYASGQQAVAIGKPEPLFFETALKQIGVEPARAIMVGDDIETDIGGAAAAGLRGVLVKTGKYRDNLVKQSDVQPARIIDSLADLPPLLPTPPDRP